MSLKTNSMQRMPLLSYTVLLMWFIAVWHKTAQLFSSGRLSEDLEYPAHTESKSGRINIKELWKELIRVLSLQ
jgi:hypothetical protein